MSHIEIYKTISESKDDYGLVLEDDSIPDEKFNNNVHDYLNKLPREFDLFYISPGKGNFTSRILKGDLLKKFIRKKTK